MAYHLQLEMRIVDESGETVIPVHEIAHGSKRECEEIAREMKAHFDHVAAEDPAARSVADALSRPQVPQESMYPFADAVVLRAMRAAGTQAGAALDAVIVGEFIQAREKLEP